jgi:pimeloyl-ACP methyl ester carboxylesterase
VVPFSLEDLQRVVVNDVSLAYLELGEGEPLVLVHGSSSDIRTWEDQVDALSRGHRVIGYSRRYARPNADIVGDADDPMIPHVEDLEALLDHLDAKPAHLVGHSYGGFVCLLAALRYPDLARSLVLMEPPAISLFVSTPPKPKEILGLFLRRPRTALAIVKFGGRAVSPAREAFRRGDTEAAIRAFGRGVLGKKAFNRLSKRRRDQVRDNVNADRAQVLGTGFPPLDDDELRSVRTPTLLLRGEKSPALFGYLLDRLEELLPHAEQRCIPGASHIMHEDNPGGFQETVLGFLARF